MDSGRLVDKIVATIGPTLLFNLLSVPCHMAQFQDDFEKFNGHELA